MTSQEKDKFICEKLGICWHEIAGGKCRYCGELGWDLENPDFTSEAGRVQLLKLTELNFGDDKCVPVEWMIDGTGKFRDAVFWWLGGGVYLC